MSDQVPPLVYARNQRAAAGRRPVAIESWMKVVVGGSLLACGAWLLLRALLLGTDSDTLIVPLLGGACGLAGAVQLLRGIIGLRRCERDRVRQRALAPDPVACERLQAVDDDEAARDQAYAWAREQMLVGATAEEVAAGLVAGGWPQDVADELSERARQATLAHRGATTRAEAADASEASYRRSMSISRRVGGGLWVTTVDSVRALAENPAPRKPPADGDTNKGA